MSDILLSPIVPIVLGIIALVLIYEGRKDQKGSTPLLQSSPLTALPVTQKQEANPRMEQHLHIVKAMLWTGGDAPNREAVLKVTHCGYFDNRFAAYWEPGYCGCPDCSPLVGIGETEAEAIADYWERWEEKYGPAK